MNGITFYKLQSPYSGDITKNCSLNGIEVDTNFFNLEGRDIKSVSIDNTDIVITLLNGNTLQTSLCEFTKDLNVKFDTDKGVLTITRNGVDTTIDGFVTKTMLNEIISSINSKQLVNVNGTLIGNGSSKFPIGISPLQTTGVYKPVLGKLDLTSGEQLPQFDTLSVGDRYVTIEYVSDNGFLYDYNGVKKIVCDLISENTGWRIPTKEDWDDMLNAIEPCECDRNHGSAMSNKFLGNIAGKLLKSSDMWQLENLQPGGCDGNCQCGHTHHHHCEDSCHTPFNGCHCSDNCVHEPNPNKGIDKFGFAIKPVGYADDTKYCMYFKERAWFWTATNQQFTNVYTKRFDYNRSKVYQDIVGIEYFLSLRLIKDYDGDNFVPSEDILGNTYSTVLMPSLKHGHSIWTATNLAAANRCYNPLAPNDGQNIFDSKHVFINEWNGCKWIRNEVKEGESVVVINDNQKDTEYRVIDGEFVNVTDYISQNVLELLNPTITELQVAIDKEASDRQLADEALDAKFTEAIQAESDERKSADVELKGNIDKEASDRQLADENIEKKLLVSEGSAFDKENGILTLKSIGGENDIQIQLSLNFGEI